MDAAVAEAIIEFRKDEDFTSIDDLKNVPGVTEEAFAEMREWITVRSSAFSMEFNVNFNGAVAGIRAYVVREGDKTRPIYWQVL